MTSTPSPIGAADVAREDGIPGWVELVPEGAGTAVWWDEPRPLEGGRRCVVGQGPGGVRADLIPAGFNARSRLHEYGGRPWRPAVHAGRPVVVFANWADQRLYRFDPVADPAPAALTPEDPAVRYGDLFCPPGRPEVWCVRERLGAHPREVVRAVVAVPLDGSGRVRVLAEGHHFLTCPRLSPDGAHLSWIGWNHPDMPWDSTELCVAPLDGGAPHRVVAGGPGEAVVQAEWRDADTLWAVTDPGGWWNLHLVSRTGGAARPVAAREEEFGGALWKPGLVWFAPLSDGRAVAVHGTGAGRRLGVVDPETGEITDLPLPHTDFGASLHALDGKVVCVAGSAEAHHAVVVAELDGGGHEALTPRSGDPRFAGWLPRPRAEVFHRPDGQGVHANLYPPTGGPDAPWLVFAHGGPTGDSPIMMNLEVAYFTSRGFGVADVDYGGSVGYGRAYRERLREAWGVADVEDCAAVARGLVARGLADPGRLAIRGGSAGGWTALASLTSAGLYAGAVAHYAITDPIAWAAGTHDFESRYLDGLIGPLPETAGRYRERSPVLNAAKASGPALLMHGLEDVIVEPAQSAAFAEAMTAAGIPCTHLTFPGEQHGWRQASTIVTSLQAELAFYRDLFGMEA